MSRLTSIDTSATQYIDINVMSELLFLHNCVDYFGYVYDVLR